MKWEVTNPPLSLPVTWELARAHLRLSDDADKEYVTACMADATEYAQDYMDCSLLPQEITVTFDDHPAVIRPPVTWLQGICWQRLALPRGPVQSVTSVTAAGVLLDPATYTLRRSGHSDYLDLPGPAGSVATPIVVVYQAGHLSVPNTIRRGLLLHVASLYEGRGGTSDRTPGDACAAQCVFNLHRRTSMVG